MIPKRLTGSHRNRWPDDTETTGRFTPKQVAGRYRNDWPVHTEMSGRTTPKFAIHKEGLAAALEYCQKQGVEPPQCSLTADSDNATMLREKAARMLSETKWWKKRLGAKAGRDFERQRLSSGKVTNIVSDETLRHYLSKKRG